MKESARKTLDALSQGINAELASYVFYKKAAGQIDDLRLSELLNKLAGEEKDHYQTLEGQYDSLVRSEKWVTYNDIMRKDILPEIPEQMTENHKRRIESLENIKSSEKILQMALELENEAKEFYALQIDRVDDSKAKEMYSFLSAFEQEHINTITDWLAMAH